MRRRAGARERRWAAIFADDLLGGCSDLFVVFGAEVLTLPISIPVDQDGVVVLQPRAPVDAHRVPASMSITRLTPDTYDIRIERAGGGMVVPGLGETPLARLTFLVTREGLEIGPGPLPLDETSPRALATALLITLRTKLAQAERGERPSALTRGDPGTSD